jgi:hypothetical protein
MFVPGLHKWIAERRWESLPEDTAGSAPRMFEPAKKPAPSDELPATAADIAAAFEPLKSIFKSTRFKS